jgi:SAM-dependent methyltransferase
MQRVGEAHTEHRHRHHPTPGSDSSDAIWLAASWPFVRDQLPSPPASVLELGCGRIGGHIPALLRSGYDATGVDPEAPEELPFRREEFEDYKLDAPVDAVVASLSLHHVGDVSIVLDLVLAALRPGGRLVVLEWISEDFDEATARWCFRHRLREPADSGGWLAMLRDEWTASKLPWESFFQGRLRDHGLHSARSIRHGLDARFRAIHESRAPYYFADLADVDPAAEQAAIDAGEIRAGCLRYAGNRAP